MGWSGHGSPIKTHALMFSQPTKAWSFCGFELGWHSILSGAGGACGIAKAAGRTLA